MEVLLYKTNRNADLRVHNLIASEVTGGNITKIGGGKQGNCAESRDPEFVNSQ